MINRTVLCGRMTRDIEIRMTQSGMTVGTFTLAVNRNKSGNGGQVEADFIRCIAFGKTAEILEKYTSKGSMIAADGRIQTGSYMGKDGKKVYTTDVVCDTVQLISSSQETVVKKPSGEEPPAFNPMRNEENPFNSSSYSSGLEIDDDEDLPF